MRNTIKAAVATLMVLCMIAVFATPAIAVKPTYTDGKYPAMSEGWKAGSVSGRITIYNDTVGLSGAYVAIVNAADPTHEYFNTTTNEDGYYQILNVNASVAYGGSSKGAYVIYANHTLFGEGYSEPFDVTYNTISNRGGTATANVIMTPIPASIVVTAEKSNVVADSLDNTKISAYVTDALGNPVADGTLVYFKINNTTGFKLDNTLGGAYNKDLNGVFNVASPGSLPAGQSGVPGQFSVNVSTKGGYAELNYGWVAESLAGENVTIEAYYAEDMLINGSTTIYFSVAYCSWFGNVVDSYLVPYPGIEVTLHVIGWDGSKYYEQYNMTTLTSSAQPYVGAFVFDNIEINSTTAHAYASAKAELTDNVTIPGQSQNYTLNKTRTSSGFIVLHVPPPDALKVTADPNPILVGGDVSTITAQLYYNGLPYKRPGVKVNFDTKDAFKMGEPNKILDNPDTIATLPKVKTNSTDATGKATIPLTSNQTMGNITVTANTTVSRSITLYGEVDVQVVGWGTISGLVSDKNRQGIPLANVTLWYAEVNYTADSTGHIWDSKGIVKVPENPQLSNDGRTGPLGIYTYERIPWGLYNVTAEKDNHLWFAHVNLTAGTYTANVAIPDYVYTAPATPTVTAVPTTPTPTTSAATATPTPTPGFETLFAVAGLLGVAYLITRKEN